MNYPQIKTNIKHRATQSMQMRGINLTDNHQDGQLEKSKGISTARFPYVTTTEELQPVDTGIASGYQPVSMYAWEKLFVVSDEPGESGGYKCFYGGQYCGDAVNLDLPKQYAVVNSKLVMWPDKVYFNLYDNEMSAHPLTTAPLLTTITSGTIIYRKKVTS